MFQQRERGRMGASISPRATKKGESSVVFWLTLASPSKAINIVKPKIKTAISHLTIMPSSVEAQTIPSLNELDSCTRVGISGMQAR